MTLIYTIISKIISPNSENSENKKNEEMEVWKYILLIIGLFVYFLLSGAYNSYRLVINKLYSPITLSLTYCFLDPLFLIFYEMTDKKGKSIKKNNIIFIINIILLFFIVFFISIYNEIFVLFCFDLEKDTYHEISNRSESEMIDALNELTDEPIDIQLD